MIHIDTPMTNDRVVIFDGNPWVNAPFARSLERELNAANVEIEEKRKDVVWLATEKAKLEERINRLEEMYEKEIGENDKFIGTNLQALLTRELNTANQRIKRLVQAGDCLLSHRNSTDYHEKVREWDKAKKDKP